LFFDALTIGQHLARCLLTDYLKASELRQADVSSRVRTDWGRVVGILATDVATSCQSWGSGCEYDDPLWQKDGRGGFQKKGVAALNAETPVLAMQDGSQEAKLVVE